MFNNFIKLPVLLAVNPLDTRSKRVTFPSCSRSSAAAAAVAAAAAALSAGTGRCSASLRGHIPNNLLELILIAARLNRALTFTRTMTAAQSPEPRALPCRLTLLNQFLLIAVVSVIVIHAAERNFSF